jgi:hypothetical protein
VTAGKPRERLGDRSRVKLFIRYWSGPLVSFSVELWTLTGLFTVRYVGLYVVSFVF